MIRVYKDPESLVIAVADFIVGCAKEAIDRDGRFNIALSGGGSPRKLYALLASVPYRKKIAWSKVFFFFGDERYVPPTHPDSTYAMAKETLFGPLDIDADHVLSVDTSLLPSEAAARYEKRIRGHFTSDIRFDLILLGLGEDAHTASLFPNNDVLHEKHALVREVFVTDGATIRITFTARLINLAHRVVFLAYGESKSKAVRHVLEDPLNVDAYPAQLISPENGERVWYLDEQAASEIRQPEHHSPAPKHTERIYERHSRSQEDPA